MFWLPHTSHSTSTLKIQILLRKWHLDISKTKSKGKLCHHLLKIVLLSYKIFLVCFYWLVCFLLTCDEKFSSLGTTWGMMLVRSGRCGGCRLVRGGWRSDMTYCSPPFSLQSILSWFLSCFWCILPPLRNIFFYSCHRLGSSQAVRRGEALPTLK